MTHEAKAVELLHRVMEISMLHSLTIVFDGRGFGPSLNFLKRRYFFDRDLRIS